MVTDKLIFETILERINSGNFDNAEMQLKSFIDKSVCKSDENFCRACLLRGYLHTKWEYKNKSEDIARQMLLQNIESDYTKPRAYCFYADVLKDKNTALNYLKNGLKKFPEDAWIYSSILRYCSKAESNYYICEIKNKEKRNKRSPINM